jgi:hypothetical protein
MRAILAIAVLLALASPWLPFADSPRPRYTTLIVEYTGEVIGAPATPVVITTSQKEGEWYKQHLSPDVGNFLTHIQVVPQSVLNEVTELPLLKRALERAKPVDDEFKTQQSARFTAGIGNDNAQIVLGKQPSTKILKGIERIAARYPSLKRRVQALENQLK